MKLLGLTIARNDEDIIEAFVKHNLSFLDILLVIENSSADRTREKLVNLMKEGLPLIIFDDPGFGAVTSDRLSVLLKNTQRFFPCDYFFLLHPDEFIVCPSRTSLEETLQKSSKYQSLYLQTLFYVMNSTQKNCEIQELFVQCFEQRIEDSCRYYSKVAHKNSLKNAEANYNIKEINQKSNGGDVLPPNVLRNILIAKIPVRSRNQLISHAVINRPNELLINDSSDPYLPAWVKIYQIVKNNPDISGQETRQISINFCDLLSTPKISKTLITEPFFLVQGSIGNASQSVHTLNTVVNTLERTLESKTNELFSKDPVNSHGHTEISDQPKGTLGVEFHHHNLYIDLPPFRYIFDKYSPDSVLDLGCGLGGYIQKFNEWGTPHVFGIDGFKETKYFLCDGNYLQHDLAESIDLEKTYDIVICVEVAEHIHEKYADQLISNILRHAGKMVIFSAARPGQPGNNHINCKPTSSWLNKWERLGWYADPFDSLAFRSLSTYYWFRRNPVILKPALTLNKSMIESSDSLDYSYEASNIQWINQPPKIYTYPLSEQIPQIKHENDN